MKFDLRKDLFLYVAFIQSVIATLGSLFFSEVMKYTPCVLCWYQRICMYPLVAILWVGFTRKDKNVIYYALPLSITGMLIAIYHNLIYYHVIAENLLPCSDGVPCTTRFFSWFGFITIPLLSLIAFIVVTICLYAYRKKSSN